MDIEITNESFTNGTKPKTGKIERKTSDARLEVRGISMIELNQAFQTRYNFYIDPNENAAVIDGITCAIVKFSPKPNLAVRKTADQFINRAEGLIYINLDNFDIVRVNGSIKNPFNFTFSWYFIPVARVDVFQFEFSVGYTKFNNMLVEQSLTGLADYEIRNRSTEKFTSKITNHRMR